jgi:hypothetical protein
MFNVTNVASPAPVSKAANQSRRITKSGKPSRKAIVLYRGSQWRATTKHVETIDGKRYGQNYWFDIKRLAEDLGPWGWPCQLAEKNGATSATSSRHSGPPADTLASMLKWSRPRLPALAPYEPTCNAKSRPSTNP